MKKFLGCLVVVCAAGMTVRAQIPAPAATNAPADPVVTNAPAASTGTVTEVTASLSPSEWVGYVRVLRDEKGGVRAVRLVSDGKLIAVDLTDKGIAMGKTPKSRKLLVKGELVTRDNRPWLVVSEFEDATDKPAAASVPPSPPVATNTPPAAASTNTPPVLATTNTPAVAPAP